jgi:hypothetical protein
MRTFLMAALGAFVVSVPAHGHHSFSASYFEDQTMAIAGHVVAFDYRNPHAWVHVASPDAAGQTQTYGAEWGSPNRLRQQGVARDTIKPGDYVIVTGSPSRNAADRKMHLKKIERPADGWTWVGRRERR